MAVVLATIAASDARGQTAAEPSSPGSAAVAASAPLAKFNSKDNLFFYVEFSGLDAHEASWNKTAAYQMLTATPLVGMLEELSTQIFDKVLTYQSPQKVKGQDFVRFFKHMVKRGFALGLVLKSDTGSGELSTLVVRGASSKEMRAATGRVMGWMMGNKVKPRLERKENRTVVAVPYIRASNATPETAWAWWSEKDDLVVTSNLVRVDEVLSRIDGKTPSAVDHPLLQQLSKSEGAYEPVGVFFVDVEGIARMSEPKNASVKKLKESFEKFLSGSGIKRIDLRWGFEQDAVVTVVRVTAPKPRQGLLTLLDQPAFDKGSLIPMPEGVESFLSISLSPSEVLEKLADMVPGIRTGIDEFQDAISKAGKVDLQQDLLRHMGPRMSLFVSPGKVSAATGDDSSDLAIFQNVQPLAIVSSLQSNMNLPKLTLVAEVDDPEKFGRALDAVMIAVNNVLKQKAAEAAEATQTDEPANASPNGRGGPAGREGPGGGGPRGNGRTRPKAPGVPKFERMPGQVVNYVLKTPSDATYRIGPHSFKPSVRLDGKYVAISVMSDSAELAIKAAKNKDWKPSEDARRAIEPLPQKLILLALSDSRDIVAPVLSSLPGTLQTSINTAIAASRMQTNAANPANAPNAGMGGPDVMGGRRGRGIGGPGGGRPAGPGNPARGGFRSQAPTPGTAADSSMVQFKIDADKLPSAQDIRSRLFPSTVSVTTSDEEIRIVFRDAFPDALWAGILGLGMTIPSLEAIQNATPAASAAPGASAPAGGPQPGRIGPGPGAGRDVMGGPRGPDAGPGRRRRGGD
jgi:hypothetical protein